MTTVHITSIPEKALSKFATPFRVIVPKQLEKETALAIYQALASAEGFKAQDPFWLPDISCVFPGTVYHDDLGFDLEYVRDVLADVVEELADDIGDDLIIELDVPDDLTDAVVLDVTDLTQPSA